MTKEKSTAYSEQHAMADETLNTILASYNIDSASRDLFEKIVASAPQPSVWHQLRAWLNVRVVGVGLATTMAGALCFSIVTTSLLAQNADDTANNGDYVDYGQEWLG